MSDVTTHSIGAVRVLWQATIQGSRLTQCAVLLLQGGIAWVVILTPWPVSRWIAVPLLLTVLFWDLVKAQRRFGVFQGSIAIRSDRILMWRDHRWPISTSLMTPWGVWLLLLPGTPWPRVWLARDSMQPAEWRALCRILQIWVGVLT